MGVMETLTAVLTITMPIIVTVVLGNYQTHRIIRATIETSNRQTQRIVRNSNKQTQQLLREIKETQENIKETQEGIRRCLVKLERLQRRMYRDHTCLLRKLNVGMHANALMHGWSCAEGLTPEQIRKLPEPKVYDLELGICYYKS